jgi:SAM-dependent MidA family methyltransferase
MSPAPRRRPGSGASNGALSGLISYSDFVDLALFDPTWGYYSTGGVRFGEGGHYDTYPLALSPLFGRMVANYAMRMWKRCGRPARFEICELGAGNGQLCLDTLLTIDARAAADASWQRFRTATRYRIVERSAALGRRQRHTLGPVTARVTWQRTDLAQRPVPRPFGRVGLIVANEVLDCLPHHKVVGTARGAGVVHVGIEVDRRRQPATRLATLMSNPRTRDRVRFRERVRPLADIPALHEFVDRYYPELRALHREAPPVFVAPRVASLLAHTAGCYERADALWIDYGDQRPFHLRAPEARKAFAGPPRTGRRVYDAPGADDITFMVDFTLAADAAHDAGWRVACYGPQAELARLSGVRVDARAVDEIVQQRALVWMLALAGVGPERDWRRGAIGFRRDTAAGAEPVRRYAERSVREFTRARATTFKLLLLRR